MTASGCVTKTGWLGLLCHLFMLLTAGCLNSVTTLKAFVWLAHCAGMNSAPQQVSAVRSAQAMFGSLINAVRGRSRKRLDAAGGTTGGAAAADEPAAQFEDGAVSEAEREDLQAAEARQRFGMVPAVGASTGSLSVGPGSARSVGSCGVSAGPSFAV